MGLSAEPAPADTQPQQELSWDAYGLETQTCMGWGSHGQFSSHLKFVSVVAIPDYCTEVLAFSKMFLESCGLEL